MRRFYDRKRKRGPIPWKTEAELCDDFAAGARRIGWVVYPETAGFDMLLVHRDGIQLGVEAKLRPNVDVLAQVCDRIGHAWKEAPDYVALLVARSHSRFETVAFRLGFPVIDGRDAEDVRETLQALDQMRRARPSLPWDPPPEDEADDPELNPWRQVRLETIERDWDRAKSHAALPRCELPEFVPDLPAGVPGPVQLTPWKVKAVRLCLRLRQRGWVTTADFQELELSPTRWVRGRHRWLDVDGKDGRRTRYIPRPGATLPDEQRPELTQQIIDHLEGSTP